MKEPLQKKFSTDLSKSLLTTLIRYFPPKEFDEALIDVVNILIDGLSRGDIYIDLKKSPINIELQYKGWPDLHMKALSASGWATGANSPIVLNGDMISWRRTHDEIVGTVQKILLRNKLVHPQSKELKVKINSKNLDHLNSQQKRAINLVLTEKIILLSGGPGTGKTSTILQMLLKALERKPSLEIGMAAPTGKATKKLKETIQSGLKHLQDSQKDLISQIPCKTLHKWLEVGPNGFRRNSKRLLRLELIVIDEMSMVDLSIINGVLDALPKSCQIILVGDPNQLLPVSSGGIWQILQSKEINKNFIQNSVKLTKSYRNKGDIALSRNTLKDKGLDAFWRLLSTKEDSSNINLHFSSLKSIPDSLVKILYDYKKNLEVLTAKCIHCIPDEAWESSMVEVPQTEEILELFSFKDSLFVLCPQTYGPWGVRKIHQLILGDAMVKGVQNWEQGTPIMTRINQPEIGLANGDVGIIIGNKNKKRFLFNFFSEEQKLVTRLINPSRLSMLDAAFAMTIHKSQGSEANRVVLLWPKATKVTKGEKQKKLYTDDYEKRLIYTAITRAKEELLIITDKEEDF
tara:strand:+ start:2112 stop:3833 length:1722 start_codon:yes stop_codon:yes gene_type:complete